MMNREKTFFVFDVESVGLHGEGFAVGYVVVKDGKTLAEGLMACNRSIASGRGTDLEWINKNVPIIPATHSSPRSMRNAFWSEWRRWHQQGALMVAECAWPVEARFLIQCVEDCPDERLWKGPYPLHDLASILLAHGRDPMKTHDRLPEELPVHNPLADARLSARLLNFELCPL